MNIRQRRGRGARGGSMNRVHGESVITNPVDSVFAFVQLAEFEILSMLFFLIAFLIFKDVLNSLKPKESIVTRQTWLEGQCSLAKIAAKLNISREMVRKHERKAFMKLRHPTSLDYLRKPLKNLLIYCGYLYS